MGACTHEGGRGLLLCPISIVELKRRVVGAQVGFYWCTLLGALDDTVCIAKNSDFRLVVGHCLHLLSCGYEPLR